MPYINPSAQVFMEKFIEPSITQIKNNMLLKLYPLPSSDKIKNYNNAPLIKSIS